MPAHVPSGIGPLDAELGGLPAGTLVQVHGPSGAGKTTAALQLARACAPVALVAAEAPHPARVRQVLDGQARRILVARPATLTDQTQAVTRAARLLAAGKVRAVVLDSLTFLYRFEQMASLEALPALYEQHARAMASRW